MQNNIAEGMVQSATKELVAGTAALALLEDATELFVAQGQRVLRFDLTSQRAPRTKNCFSFCWGVLANSGHPRSAAARA